MIPLLLWSCTTTAVDDLPTAAGVNRGQQKHREGLLVTMTDASAVMNMPNNSVAPCACCRYGCAVRGTPSRAPSSTGWPCVRPIASER